MATKKKESSKETMAVSKTSVNIEKISSEDRNKLFNNSSSGLDNVKDARTMRFPRELKIVQDNTGDNKFENPDDNDRANKGKIFIRPEAVVDDNGDKTYPKLTTSDLHEALTCTLINVEYGVEIWEKETNPDWKFPRKKTLCRSNKMITQQERDSWLEKHNPNDDDDGLHYTNMVKVVMTPFSAEETIEMMTQDRNPFVVVQLSGGNGWKTWQKIRTQMTEIKKSLNIKTSLSNIISSLFKITWTTAKDGQYYNFEANVSLNDANDALALESLVSEFSENFSFFYNGSNSMPELRDAGMQTEEVVDVESQDEESEDLLEEDLPF